MLEIFDELNGDFGNTTLQCLDTISPTMQSIVVHSEPIIKHSPLACSVI